MHVRRSPYWSLAKPRIVALLCLTGTMALLAAGEDQPLQIAAFVVAGACIAGGSAAFNCLYDRDLDRRMERTADRPLPSGRLSPWRASGFVALLFIVGTGIGLATLPTVAVGYMWLGVAAYVGLYTIGLKRRHWLGVVLGGSAGSFPVLAGWTAVRPLTLTPLVFAALVFAWTPAHAWALAFVYRDDFAAADVPTLPVVTTERRVGRAVWVATLSTVVVAGVVAWVGPWPTGVVAGVASVALLGASRRFGRERSEATAVRLFFTTNCFVAVTFVAWAASRVFGPPTLRLSAVAGAFTGVTFLGVWLAKPTLRDVSTASGSERWVVAGLQALSRQPTADQREQRDD